MSLILTLCTCWLNFPVVNSRLVEVSFPRRFVEQTEACYRRNRDVLLEGPFSVIWRKNQKYMSLRLLYWPGPADITFIEMGMGVSKISW